MSDDAHLWMSPVKILYIRLHRTELCWGAGVLWRAHIARHAAGIHHMTAHGVVALGAVGYFPWINIGVLVVVDEPHNLTVEADKVGIADLPPAAAAGSNRGGVHPADVIRSDVTTLGSCRAMNYEILQLSHGCQAFAAGVP